jgi:hypothetical protein
MNVILQAIKALLRKVDNKTYDDLKNKPFGSEFVEGAASFDGNLTGKKYYEMDEGMTLVKISDTPITKEKLIGSTMVVKGMDAIDPEIPNELEMTIAEDMVMQESVNDTSYMLGVVCGEVPAVFAFHGDCSAMGMPPEGTYFIYGVFDPEAPPIYVHSLSCLNGVREVITKIDAKYLPEVGLKADEVASMINEAIGEAIGGSY